MKIGGCRSSWGGGGGTVRLGTGDSTLFVVLVQRSLDVNLSTLDP